MRVLFHSRTDRKMPTLDQLLFLAERNSWQDLALCAGNVFFCFALVPMLPMREIINSIFYVTRAGCPWRLLPNDLPPWGTIYRWFAAWRDDGRFERIKPRARDGRSRTGRARRQPLGRDYRQPE
jgi:transposase